MTEGVLLKALGSHGVEKFNPLGARFDPNLHSALFEVPDPTKEDKTVAHVVKAGFSLHGRCVRRFPSCLLLLLGFVLTGLSLQGHPPGRGGGRHWGKEAGRGAGGGGEERVNCP